MKNTALSNKHISLGAKMVHFAGFSMPVSYAGLNTGSSRRFFTRTTNRYN